MVASLCLCKPAQHVSPDQHWLVQNKQNIASACSSTSTSAGFANSSILLNACQGFLSSSELSSGGSSPQQITVACAVMAVQMALLCSSQAGINCAGVSQNTFTLFMSAEAAQLPGVNGR